PVPDPAAIDLGAKVDQFLVLPAHHVQQVDDLAVPRSQHLLQLGNLASLPVGLVSKCGELRVPGIHENLDSKHLPARGGGEEHQDGHQTSRQPAHMINSPHHLSRLGPTSCCHTAQTSQVDAREREASHHVEGTAASLHSALSGGAGPDLWDMGDWHYKVFTDNKFVAPLDPTVFGYASTKEMIDAYVPGTTSIFERDGKLYGLFSEYNTLALFYNLDMFKAAGVAPLPADK